MSYVLLLLSRGTTITFLGSRKWVPAQRLYSTVHRTFSAMLHLQHQLILHLFPVNDSA